MIMNIGFIGTGKISSAVIEAICTSDLQDYQIFVSPRNAIKSTRLEEKFSEVTRTESNQEVVVRAEIIFIALKPDVYKEVLSDLRFKPEHIIVSLIPFSSYGVLKKLVAPAKDISRATPLPTVVNHVCPIQVFRAGETVKRILGTIGQLIEVETEEQLHTIWTLTCLISPYYDLMSELSEWAAGNNVDKELADKYIADMFHSLAKAASLSDAPDFKVLSSHAATPGGLNEWTARSIDGLEAHTAYTKAADFILSKFRDL
jgi:pyrroline-5-carboxylate reductase